jgi:superfamily II DNA or RNA helicase/HKD family nuclease
MNNDHKFFTNEPDASLLDRFKSTLKDTRFFDALVGFFRSSGYYLLQEPLEQIEKTRILVGMGIDRDTYIAAEQAKTGQQQIEFDSSASIKKEYARLTTEEIENSADSFDVEKGIRRLAEMIKLKKIELRAHPSKSIHAKVYICRYKEGDRDFGSIITGSSNFSQAGLVANHEFNVQLKDRPDVEYALKKFEELWAQSCDVGEDFITTVSRNTWLNDNIMPYDLYLKVLYEYFEEDINLQELEFDLPPGFLNLEYQKQAVASAHKILEAYNGVFLADVVGLGKTYISAMLAQQLEGSKVIICPPVLIPYWKQTFHDFGVKKYEVHSIGKLDEINRDRADYIFIDEAHRFRNEITQSYAQLQEICFNKKVILVTATPFNNKFEDILSQIKLFQPPKNSTIPGVPDLDAFFTDLRKRREIAREKAKKSGKKDGLRDAIRAMAVEVREKVLKYVMVRRTRKEIMNYFSGDIIKQGLKFPEVQEPEKMVYEFDVKTAGAFNKTLELLKKFTYSRYVPFMYLKAAAAPFDLQQQINIRAFMKEILVKRLESSFHAFKKTLGRFLESYEKFIGMFEKGTVLIGKKTDVYELLENDDEEALLKAIEEKGVRKFKSTDFKKEYEEYLGSDYSLLKEINSLWKGIDSDPKLEKLLQALKGRELKDKKMIIFSESRETGMYLYDNIRKTYGDKVMFYSSIDGSHDGIKHDLKTAREIISSNFDPNNDKREDRVRYLISTDVLSEGTNLHAANIVINYDLPWNPTRVLQRVGRVNRVGTAHDKIFIYNFFPTDESEKEIGLEQTIKAKLQAFHDTLGDDAKYLTEEEEISSHSLFGDYIYKKLTDISTYTGETETEDSELLYLGIIRDLSRKNPEQFEKIKRLPKKARIGRKTGAAKKTGLVTFFRKGKLKKFFLSGTENSKELVFMEAVKLFKCDKDEKRQSSIKEDYYSLLDANKAGFDRAISGDMAEFNSRGTRSNEYQIIKRLKTAELEHNPAFTGMDEEYIRNVRDAIERGIIPKKTCQIMRKLLEKEKNPLKILYILKKYIKGFMIIAENDIGSTGDKIREIILSEYFME